MSKLVAFLVSVTVTAAVIVPVVAYAYGRKDGPCSVSVSCDAGYTIQCSGQSVCYWRLDDPGYPGFVECDGRRTYCEFPYAE